MSLRECNECGGNVSDRAKACPHCGQPLTGLAAFGRRFKPRVQAVAPKHARSSRVVRWVRIVGLTIVGLFTLLVVIARAVHPKDRKRGTSAVSPGGLPVLQATFQSELESNFTDGTLLKLGAIEISKYDDDAIDVRYTMDAKQARMTNDQAEVITIGLVKFAVDVLLAHGYNPRDHKTEVAAHAYQSTTPSATGAKRVLTFGWASYEPAVDKIEFYPARH